MDFIIQKVNGLDVSEFSHQDALRAFQDAQEPILVQVLRRSHKGVSVPDINSAYDSSSETPIKNGKIESLQDQATQTEVSLISSEWDNLPIWGQDDIDSSDSGSVVEEYLYPDEMPQSLSQYLDQDVEELQEIVLEKTSLEERLGLTLLYSNEESSFTDGDCHKNIKVDVYISEIEPGSLADKDGRLRIGDQILQINGEEIACRSHAEKLFHLSDSSVHLLVSCSNYYEEDLQNEDSFGILNENEDQPLLEGHTDLLSQRYNENGLSYTSELIIEEKDEKEIAQQDTISYGSSTSCSSASCQKNHSCSSATSTGSSSFKSSQLTPTKKSSVNKFSKSPNQSPTKSPSKRLSPSLVRGRPPAPTPIANGSESEHIYESIPEGSESEEPLYCIPFEQEFDEQTGKEKSSASNHFVQSGSCAFCHSLKDTKKCSLRCSNHLTLEERDSSSAYNTGDSTGSNSNQRGLELSLGHDDILRQSTLTLCPVVKESVATQLCQEGTSSSNVRHRMKMEQKVRKALKNSKCVSFIPSSTVYTNFDNLSQTICLQEQLFQQSLRRKEQLESFQKENYSEQTQKNSPKKENSSKMEWKVKIRPDGSRYITRRPVRKEILKERALRLSQERSALTTDDETASELKVGRYWTREERKRHLEKEKERRRKMDLLRHQQLSSESACGVGGVLTLENGIHQGLWRDRRRPVASSHPSECRYSSSLTKGRHSWKGGHPPPPLAPEGCVRMYSQMPRGGSYSTRFPHYLNATCSPLDYSHSTFHSSHPASFINHFQVPSHSLPYSTIQSSQQQQRSHLCPSATTKGILSVTTV